MVGELTSVGGEDAQRDERPYEQPCEETGRSPGCKLEGEVGPSRGRSLRQSRTEGDHDRGTYSIGIGLENHLLAIF